MKIILFLLIFLPHYWMDFVILIRVLKIPINKVSNIDNIGTIMRPLSSSDLNMEKYTRAPIGTKKW